MMKIVRRALVALLLAPLLVLGQPRLPSIIAAFNDIFSGAGGLTNRTHIAEMSKRRASYGERIFATGLGTVASPSSLGWEGAITDSDVAAALSLP